MPTLHQIKSTNDYQGNYNPVNRKNSPYGAIAKFVIFSAIVLGAYLYSIKPKVYQIPDNVFIEQEHKRFLYLFSTPIKKVIWFGADCPVSHQKMDMVDYAIRSAKLDDVYEQRAFLQNRLMINCKDCLDTFIMDKCSKGYCIVVPAKHQIIKVKNKKLLEYLKKYKNY